MSLTSNPSHYSDTRRPQLRRLLFKLIEKLETNENNDFYLYKILRAHILPLTNCAFNKSGDKFITGSYDRTCKVWSEPSLQPSVRVCPRPVPPQPSPLLLLT